MTTYEINAEAYQNIIRDFSYNPDPSYNEADTRAKIIDRILHDALGWPEEGPFVRREKHVHKGYLDYKLASKHTHIIIEAKRIGKSFALPSIFSFQKQLSVKNLLHKQIDLMLMYNQVVKYAHECGVVYCALTNGTQWLIFPGVRTDNIHIRNSRVIVFNGFESIKSNFLDFWSYLSFESAREGGPLRKLILPINLIEPSYAFATEERANVPYERNLLSSLLTSILPKYFGDLYGDPSQTRMLKECYVSDEPIDNTISRLGLRTGDEGPSNSMKKSGPILHFYSLPKVSDTILALFDTFLKAERNLSLQILVGRVGIGKTTFIHYFLEKYSKKMKNENYTLYLDLHDSNAQTDLDKFFLEAMWDMFKKHPEYNSLMSHQSLFKIFADEIETLTNGPLLMIKDKDPDIFTTQIAQFLTKQISDRPYFLKKLIEYINTKTKSRFIVIFDNVDQIPNFELQQKIIRFAHSKGRELKCFLIIAMWEETYYSSKKSGQILSTIRNVPIQITRQSVTSVITKRVNYIVKQIKNGSETLTLLDQTICDQETFCDFLELIHRSLLVDNRRIRMFLESIALGNIRRALEIFHKFFTAGSLNISRSLRKMKDSKDYIVPQFDFITSIMLGSNRYYSERKSEIINLFAIGDMERPSHFSRLRILRYLLDRRNEATPFGTGFVIINKMLKYFGQIGMSQQDFSASLVTLVNNSFVEDDLRSQNLTKKSQAIRITPTGRYYATFLYKEFGYVDLVWQDTPFFDKKSYDIIRPFIDSVDLNSSLKRCKAFINYLENQESEEIITLSKLTKEYAWEYRFVPGMQITFEKFNTFVKGKFIKK